MVQFIWDQGWRSTGGAGASLFGYGTVAYARQIRQWLRLPDGSRRSEASSYAASGLPGLRAATSHGAMAMSHAAGPLTVRERLSPSRFGGSDATLPPVRQPARLRDTHVAFVQLPPSALNDASGRWLGAFALDGLHAIRFYGEQVAKCTEKIVANLSSGRKPAREKADPSSNAPSTNW